MFLQIHKWARCRIITGLGPGAAHWSGVAAQVSKSVPERQLRQNACQASGGED